VRPGDIEKTFFEEKDEAAWFGDIASRNGVSGDSREYPDRTEFSKLL
jgi:hypothetical protein